MALSGAGRNVRATLPGIQAAGALEVAIALFELRRGASAGKISQFKEKGLGS